jgi:hypothetical protein
MIQIRYTQNAVNPNKATYDPTLLDRVRPMVEATIPLAAWIRDRVQQRGQVVGGVVPYSNNGAVRYTANQTYAAEGGGPVTARSSAAWHAAAGKKAGTYTVTGGMWRGLSVVNTGTGDAQIRFIGSSMGKAGRSSGKSFGKKHKHAGKRIPVNVRNDAKAYSIWAQQGRNVIQPDDNEITALQAAAAWQAMLATQRAFGGELVGPQSLNQGQPGLFANIVRAWVVTA